MKRRDKEELFWEKLLLLMLLAYFHDITCSYMLGIPDMGCSSFIKIKMRMWKELKGIWHTLALNFLFAEFWGFKFILDWGFLVFCGDEKARIWINWEILHENWGYVENR